VTAKAATVTITITKAGVVPSQAKISMNDSVTWMNTDTADHQLVSDKAGLASPILHAGQSFTFTFSKDGNFAIKDALDKKLKAGSVVVAKAAPAAAAQAGAATVSLTTSSFQAVYNSPVTLSGSISSQQAGQKVTIQAERYGENKFGDLATVTTAAGGTWTYTARPTIRTVFQSEYGKKTSSQVTVGVRPLVTFHVLAGNRFSTKVVAARAFAGKLVQFQRRSSLGQWVTLKRVRLGSSSLAIFKANLPKGNSTLRVAFSVNQAGAGYLGGMSRTVSYHR
jgi:hypothetical protein